MAGERILVVDDGKEMRDFIVDYILKPNNFEGLIAENGLVGLEMIRQHHPDLILLDLQMPKMNGLQVLDAMKEAGIDIPVILMTLHGSEEIAVEVYRKGVRDYVKKPYTADEMLAAIERSLGEVRLRKEKEALTVRLIAANKDLNKRVHELNTLYHLGKSVTALMAIDDLLPRVIRAVVEVTSGEDCSIYIMDGQNLICRARKFPDDNQVRIVNQPAQDPFVLRTVQLRQSLLVNPPEMQAQRQKNPNLPLAVMCCPMIVGERVIGVVQVSAVRQSRNFSQQDAAMLTALTDYGAIAVENASNFGKISQGVGGEQAAFRHILEQSVAPPFLEDILQDPLGYTPPSSYVEAAVIFASLRGYQPFVENVASAQLMEFLNRYAELASQTITAAGGMIDRYLGDGFLAFFNTPEPLDDYPKIAVQTVLRLQKAVQKLNQELEVKDISFSMAMHVGVVLSGSMGVLRSINQTVLGDVVDITRRLQLIAQPNQILMTAAYHEQLDGAKGRNYIGEIKLHGRNEPLKVYELVEF